MLLIIYLNLNRNIHSFYGKVTIKLKFQFFQENPINYV